MSELKIIYYKRKGFSKNRLISWDIIERKCRAKAEEYK